MTYPANCIRGIWDSTYLDENGRPKSHLFHFALQAPRGDGWIAQSINWEDDAAVVDYTLKQKKQPCQLQYKAGVAIIPRGQIDILRTLENIKDILDYERKPIPGNQHHGNILLRSGVSKLRMKNIAACIAEVVSQVIPQKYKC